MKKSKAVGFVAHMLKIHDLKNTDLDRLAANIIRGLEEEKLMKPPLEKKCAVLLRTEHVWENENVKN